MAQLKSRQIIQKNKKMTQNYSTDLFGPLIIPKPSGESATQPLALSAKQTAGPFSQMNYSNSSFQACTAKPNKKQIRGGCPSERLRAWGQRGYQGIKATQPAKFSTMENCSTTISNNNNKCTEYKKINRQLIQAIGNRKLCKNDRFYCTCNQQPENQIQHQKNTYNNFKKQNKKCVACLGTGFADGSNNFVKCFQFIMEFKLGLKQSYNIQKLKSQNKQQQNKYVEKDRENYLQNFDISKAININRNKNQERKPKKIITLSHKGAPQSQQQNRQKFNKSVEYQKNKEESNLKTNNRINQFCSQYFKDKQPQPQQYEVAVGNTFQNEKQVMVEVGSNLNNSQVKLYQIDKSVSQNMNLNVSKNQQITKNSINADISQQQPSQFQQGDTSQCQSMLFSFRNLNNASFIQEGNISTINLGLNPMTQSIIDQSGSQSGSPDKAATLSTYGYSFGQVDSQKQPQMQQKQKPIMQPVKKVNNFFMNLTGKNKHEKSKQQKTKECVMRPQMQINTRSMFLPSKPNADTGSALSYDNCRKSLPSNCGPINFAQIKNRLSSQNNVHSGITCDECQMSPIVGTRYHCSSYMCDDDYDLCQKCYRSVNHQHQMDQIKINCNVEKICQSLDIFSNRSIRSSTRLSMGAANGNDRPENGYRNRGGDDDDQEFKIIFNSSIH